MDAAIYQIFYRDDQQGELDPAFIPYDNRENKRPDWCEYYIFRQEWLREEPKKHTLTGYLSWKFRQKTGLSGEQFRAFIAAHPGQDVYLANPFQGEHTERQSVWADGEHWHPGIAAFAQRLFDAVYPQFGIDVSQIINPVSEFAYCNYWVGTRAFWARYMAFTEAAYDYIEHQASPEERAFLDRPAVQDSTICYRPYIMERLLSTMLWLSRMGQLPAIKAVAYDLGDPLQATPLARARDAIKKLAVDEASTAAARLALGTMAEIEAENASLAALREHERGLYRLEQDALEAQYHAMTAERDALAVELGHRRDRDRLLTYRLAARLQEFLLAHPRLMRMLGRGT